MNFIMIFKVIIKNEVDIDTTENDFEKTDSNLLKDFSQVKKEKSMHSICLKNHHEKQW